MKKLCLSLLTLIAFTSFTFFQSSDLQAASKLDEIREAGVLRVGTTGDYKPFSYRADGQNFRGLDIEVAKLMAKDLGVRVEFIPTTWKTLMSDLQANKFDMGMSGISVTLKRQNTAYFSTPLMVNGKTPITLCSNLNKFHNLSDIDQSHVKVIVNPGGTNEKFARANIQKAQIVLHQDNRTIFDNILEGDVDLMITDRAEALFQSKNHEKLCAIHPEKPLSFSELGYLLPRDQDLKHWVDLWMHIQTENGTLPELKETWLDPQAWQ